MAAIGPHFGHKLGLPDKILHSRRQSLGIAQRYKISVIAVTHNLAAARGIGYHCGAAHAHAFHDGCGRAFTPGGQHHYMCGLYIGAHIVRFAKVFYTAFSLPLPHGFKAYAAKPLFGRAEQQKARFWVYGLEYAGRLGVFFKPFGFKQPGYQQKNRRFFKVTVGRQPGQRGRGKAVCVHTGAARLEYARARAQDAGLPEHGNVIVILKKHAFSPAQGSAVEQGAELVDAFFKKAVGLKGVAQARNGGVYVRNPRHTRGNAAVDDGLYGGTEEQIGLFIFEQAQQGSGGAQVAQGVEALAVKGVVQQARALSCQRRLRTGVSRWGAAHNLMPGVTHTADQHAPEVAHGPCLVAQNDDLHCPASPFVHRVFRYCGGLRTYAAMYTIWQDK